MNSEKEILNALRAGFSFFYCRTEEMDRTTSTIKNTVENFANKAGDYPFKVIVWDFEASPDPMAVITLLDDAPVGTVVIAKNWNWFLSDKLEGFNKEMVQNLQNRIDRLSSKEYRHALVIVSDQPFAEAIPESISKEFMAVDFAMPSREEIKIIYEEIIKAASSQIKGYEKPDSETETAIIEAAVGLTKQGIKNAISYGLISGDGNIDPKVVASIRAKEVEAAAGLRVGEYDIDEPQGYEQVKDFVKRTVQDKLAKGILLLGPPGTGKTHFAKWVSTIAKKKMIEMEPANMMGEGLVGQAENAWRKAIETVKSFGECILFIDEIEKGLSGAKGGTVNATDERSASQFLKFLSDERPDGCYVIATCNNIKQLPPEWVRAERWDCAPFFIDLPSAKEREKIYKHYLKYYEVKPGLLTSTDKHMQGWSGAEIRSVCRIAKMMETACDKVKQFVIPVSSTMAEQIQGLRKWSEGKTIPASTKVEAPLKRNRAVEL